MALFKRRQSDAPVPVIGVVRFSVLMQEAGEFRLSRTAVLEERRRVLFDPARLEERFRIFEAVTLSSALAQPAEAFTLLVVASSELPEPWRTRLSDLLAPHANTALVWMRPEQSLPDLVKAETGRLFPDAPRSAVLRLDDDDGLSRHFTEDLVRVMRQWDRGQDMAFSFPLGHLVGLPDTEGKLLVQRDHHTYGIACGLTMLTARNFRKGPFDLGWPHRMIDKVLPTISESRRPAYVLISHGSNDTGTESVRWRRLKQCAPISVSKARAELGRDFAHLDLEALVH